MKIRLLGWAVIEGSVWKEGSGLEIEDELGKTLMELGKAEALPEDYEGEPGGEKVEFAVIEAPEKEVSAPVYYGRPSAMRPSTVKKRAGKRNVS